MDIINLCYNKVEARRKFYLGDELLMLPQRTLDDVFIVLAAEVRHHLRKSAWTREWQLEHVEVDAWNCWHYRFRHKKSGKVAEASSREDEGGFDAAVDDLRLVSADVRKK